MRNDLPFALRQHVKAVVEDATALGNPDQEWTWTPAGNLGAQDLGAYAAQANATYANYT